MVSHYRIVAKLGGGGTASALNQPHICTIYDIRSFQLKPEATTTLSAY